MRVEARCTNGQEILIRSNYLFVLSAIAYLHSGLKLVKKNHVLSFY